MATPVLKDVYFAIESCAQTELQTILVHCGTNDAEYSDIPEILRSFHNILSLISNKYSNANIIISQLLPRKDGLNDKITAINRSIDTEFSNVPNIFIIKHGNINTRFENEKNNQGNSASILQDNKHLSKNAAPMFAGNIKYALRKLNMLPSKSYPGYNYQAGDDATKAHQQQNRVFAKDAVSPTSNFPAVNNIEISSKKTLFCEAMMQVFDRFF